MVGRRDNALARIYPARPRRRRDARIDGTADRAAHNGSVADNVPRVPCRNALDGNRLFCRGRLLICF